MCLCQAGAVSYACGVGLAGVGATVRVWGRSASAPYMAITQTNQVFSAIDLYRPDLDIAHHRANI